MPDLRALVLTPDFPPDTGGIQILVHRVASGLTQFRPEVVAINDPGAEGFDRTSDLPTSRAGNPRLPHKLNVAALNAAALRHGMQRRPDVVLSAHIVCGPAAAALARAGVP